MGRDVFRVNLLHLAARHDRAECAAHFSVLRRLVALLHLFLGFVDDAASCHLLESLVVGGSVAILEPGVADEIDNAWSEVGLDLKHVSHEILEVLGEEALLVVLLVLLPEKIDSVVVDELVVAVFGACSLEGRMSSVHGKEDDSEGEDVSNMALVWLSGQDFRCHIAWSTNL